MKDVSDGKIDANPSAQKVSWFDQVELEEAQASIEVVEAQLQPTTNWAEVVKNSRQGFELKYIPRRKLLFSLRRSGMRVQTYGNMLWLVQF